MMYPEILKTSALFLNMNGEETEKALEVFNAEFVSYKKGECLHKPYSEMSRFGLVLSGSVQACADDIDGNRMIMAEVSPGMTFGESLCYLKIKDSPVYICATENSEILWLSLEKLYSGFPDSFLSCLERRFAEMLAERTLSMNDRIQVLSKIGIRNKLMTYFGQMTQKSGSDTFTIPVNREDLAVYIGTDRSALSREMSKMKKDGIIDYYRNTVRIIR